MFDFSSPLAVREGDDGISPAISIHHLGNVGATKSERAGISKLKSDIKMVRDCSTATDPTLELTPEGSGT